MRTVFHCFIAVTISLYAVSALKSMPDSMNGIQDLLVINPEHTAVELFPFASNPVFDKKHTAEIAGTFPTPIFKMPENPTGDRELVQLTGFKYCKQLNNAIFYADARLNAAKIAALLREAEESEKLQKVDFDKKLHDKEDTKEKKRARKWLGRAWRSYLAGSVELKKLSHEGKFVYMRDIQTIYPDIIDAVASSLFVSDIINYIVRDASKPHEESYKHTDHVNEHSAHSLACYLAADGHNQWVSLSHQQKVLKFIDGHTYFDGKLGFDRNIKDLAITEYNLMKANPKWANVAIANEAYRRDGNGNLKPKTDLGYDRGMKETMKLRNKLRKNEKNDKKPFPLKNKNKIAYFLMVHNQFDNVREIIEAIYTPESIILIHVDEKNPVLKRDIKKLLEQKGYSDREVRIMKNSFNGIWGHVTLVNAHIAGYFELLDMSSQWEYVINLSGNDYPLWNNNVIWSQLERHAKNKESFITYWESSWETEYRMKSFPFLSSRGTMAGQVVHNQNKHPDLEKFYEDSFDLEKRKKMSLYYKPINLAPKLDLPYGNWRLYKQHQWMTLHRSFLEILRKSPTAMTFLAFSEFTVIPDESFFASLAVNLQTIDPETGRPVVINLLNDNRRFAEFDGHHPKMITQKDQGLMRKSALEGIYFFRKFDICRNWEMKHYIDSERNEMWTYE